MREYLDAFIVAGLAALFLITFVIRTFYIPSDSMMPTLHERDVLLVNEFAYRMGAPRRGDIVVFTPPIASPSSFIKRVIGVPGDRLSIQNGGVYVNGKRLREPYIAQQPQYALKIKDYGIFVDNGLGMERLYPEEANVPPRSRWSAPTGFPRDITLSWAITATIPRTRTCGVWLNCAVTFLPDRWQKAACSHPSPGARFFCSGRSIA